MSCLTGYKQPCIDCITPHIRCHMLSRMVDQYAAKYPACSNVSQSVLPSPLSFLFRILSVTIIWELEDNWLLSMSPCHNYVLTLRIAYTKYSKHLVLSTDPGNLPVVRIWTAKMGLFGSRPGRKPNPLPLGRTNPDPSRSTQGVCGVWLDPSVWNFGAAFLVSQFVVTFRYATDNRRIWTSVHHCLFSMYWPPWWSKEAVKRALPHSENEHQRSVNHCW